ncbi:MAG TPA: biotin/lipoyl-containing protein, partial [Bryobacteraceae bacterium]|nr:biotin/lipoyl-containing protein [Bryobacteraceae bacterium]
MTDVVMPQMGESIVEGTLTKWLKKPGERVERDEPLFEISTDKVDTEIPAPSAGVLAEVMVEEGKTVAINTVVARIDESGDGKVTVAPPKPVEKTKPEAPPVPAPAVAQPTPAAAPAVAVPAAAPEEVAGPLSPLVRKMAREYNIDLRQVKGTGAGGRITKQDAEAYIAAQAARTVAAPPPPAPVAAPVMPPPPAVPTEMPPVPRPEP